MSSRIGSVLLVLLMVGGLLFGAKAVPEQSAADAVYESNENIYIWYTDEALTDYISSAALTFYEDTNVRVIPVLYEGAEYLEDLYAASISGNQVPDLYIAQTDVLEEAAMTGIAVPVTNEGQILSSLRFPQIALDAVTYKQEYFGYPFYYETAFLLYNETYLTKMAEDTLLGQLGITLEEGQTVPEGYSEPQWQELMDAQLSSMLPTSIEDILNFADQYDAPENVEKIFNWDVSDIFYNYFFAGAYMNMGGVYGDDQECVEIYNEDSIACLTVYQQLNQFFSIDSKESSYAAVLKEFQDGKLIFTIATTDAIYTLDHAAAEGTFLFNYNVAPLPGVDAEHSAQGLSVTDAVVINGYSQQRDYANAFAKYLTYDASETLLTRTGKMPATIGEDDYVTDARDLARAVYRESEALPKCIEFSNYWISLELAYLEIWNGADVNETLRNLSSQMKSQALGAPYEEPSL